MSIEQYKAINLELTLKNQELKAVLSERCSDIHQQNVDITNLRLENKQLHEEIKKQHDNYNKLRTILLQVIEKTSAEFNRAVLIITGDDQQQQQQQTTNKLNHQNSPLKNITNENQSSTSSKNVSFSSNRVTFDKINHHKDNLLIRSDDSTSQNGVTRRKRRNINKTTTPSSQLEREQEEDEDNDQNDAAEQNAQSTEKENYPETNENQDLSPPRNDLSTIAEQSECHFQSPITRRTILERSGRRHSLNQSSSPMPPGHFVTVTRGKWRLSHQQNDTKLNSDSDSLTAHHSGASNVDSSDLSLNGSATFKKVASSTPIKVNRSIKIISTTVNNKRSQNYKKKKSNCKSDRSIDVDVDKSINERYSSGRPKRKVAPKYLAEPNIGTKLRRG